MKSIRKQLVFGVSAFIFSLCILSWVTPNRFIITFSSADLNKHYQRLQDIRTLVDRSNLPNQEVKYIVNSIDSLSYEIASQVQVQLKDTTSTKK